MSCKGKCTKNKGLQAGGQSTESQQSRCSIYNSLNSLWLTYIRNNKSWSIAALMYLHHYLVPVYHLECWNTAEAQPKCRPHRHHLTYKCSFMHTGTANLTVLRAWIPESTISRDRRMPVTIYQYLLYSAVPHTQLQGRSATTSPGPQLQVLGWWTEVSTICANSSLEGRLPAARREGQGLLRRWTGLPHPSTRLQLTHAMPGDRESTS